MAKSLDMLTGSIWDKMIIFALPLALTGMLQQLFNAADVAVLGRFVSSEAMAAVGSNVPVIGLIINLCVGLALGANVVVARALGMKDFERAHQAVHTAFVTAVVFGIFMSLLGEAFTGTILAWLDVPDSVMTHAESYLRVFLIGIPFIAIYNFLAAIFRSQGDTQTPLWALIVASIFNIAGNFFAVMVLGMGAGGVAAATVLANFLAASILFVRLIKTDGPLRLDVRHLSIVDKRELSSIVRIGWPAGLQGAVFSISNLIIQAAINSLGPDVMAGSVAAFTIEINVYCFINAFGLAATTFVSQNYGAGNLARCRRAMWVAMGLNFAATISMTILIVLFSRQLLGLFTESEAVVALAFVRILWVVIPEFIQVIMDTVSYAMRGYGYSLPPALMTLASICTVRIIWVWTVFEKYPDYQVLMAVYPVSWIVAAIGLSWLYWYHQTHLLKKKLA